MDNSTKVKAWIKLGITVAAIVIVLLIVVKNWNNTTKLWFFGEATVNVLWLIVVTAVVSVIGWRILRSVVGEYRVIRRERPADTSEE